MGVSSRLRQACARLRSKNNKTMLGTLSSSPQGLINRSTGLSAAGGLPWVGWLKMNSYPERVVNVFDSKTNSPYGAVASRNPQSQGRPLRAHPWATLGSPSGYGEEWGGRGVLCAAWSVGDAWSVGPPGGIRLRRTSSRRPYGFLAGTRSSDVGGPFMAPGGETIVANNHIPLPHKAIVGNRRRMM